MPYDINSIRRTTEKGIPDLADKIFTGIVNEEDVMNVLFKGLRPKLTMELEKRRVDEVLWLDAFSSHDLKKLSDYVETYDNEAPEYRGRHIDEANQLIALIENDDKEWYDAKSKDSVVAYRHYLDLYDKPSPSYCGKYVDSAKQNIEELLSPPPDPRIADDKAWNVALTTNTIESYKEYLEEYDNPRTSYKGIHVNDAKQVIRKLQDESDWILASQADTIEAYQRYISKYNGISGYEGQHIHDAQRAVERLTPLDPSVEDDAVWEEATRLNTLDGYRQYLANYKIHSNEAELAIRHLIDEQAWKEAKETGTKASYEKYLSICKVNEYPRYVWAHINAAKSQIWNLEKYEETQRKEEERQRRISEDNAAWDKAKKLDTRQSYEEYLAKYKKAGGGLHIREAKNAILRLQSEEDWRKACAENTLNAYKNFVDKYEPMSYKYMSMHFPEAKKKIKELTSVPSPIKWKKWLIIVPVLALCWFLWIQWQDGAWPFNIFKGALGESEDPDTVIVEKEDSLQWAIENHNIPMLKRYANIDSIRAYLPLAKNLNEVDSIKNLEETIKWLSKSFNSTNDSVAFKLRQAIYINIQLKTFFEIEAEFNKIDSTSDQAEYNYLDLYERYVSSIDRDCNEFNLGLIRYINLENKATDYIESWDKVASTKISVDGKHRKNEWHRIQKKLDEILWDANKQTQNTK